MTALQHFRVLCGTSLTRPHNKKCSFEVSGQVWLFFSQKRGNLYRKGDELVCAKRHSKAVVGVSSCGLAWREGISIDPEVVNPLWLDCSFSHLNCRQHIKKYPPCYISSFILCWILPSPLSFPAKSRLATGALLIRAWKTSSSFATFLVVPSFCACCVGLENRHKMHCLLYFITKAALFCMCTCQPVELKAGDLDLDAHRTLAHIPLFSKLLTSVIIHKRRCV